MREIDSLSNEFIQTVWVFYFWRYLSLTTGDRRSSHNPVCDKASTLGCHWEVMSERVSCKETALGRSGLGRLSLLTLGVETHIMLQEHICWGRFSQQTSVSIGALKGILTRSNVVVVIHCSPRSHLCHILDKCYTYSCSASGLTESHAVLPQHNLQVILLGCYPLSQLCFISSKVFDFPVY